MNWVLKILGSFFNGPLTQISNDLKEAYQARLNAKNDSERIEAEKQISFLEGQKEIILQAQKGKVEQWVRPLLALPFILYNMKLVVYDKMFGWGVTDPLSPELYQVEMIVLGGYFLYGTVGLMKR